MAIITPALGAARSSLNKRFPNRDKASDGWIGDDAHRGSVSGHNPDETGNAEYRDSDNFDEVRAVDLDDDLRHPTLTMQDVVDAILRTPKDRDRCSYIIYNRRIWSRSANYVPRTYTGNNPHTTHAHISGRPVNDHDDAPWLSIERLGDEDMPLTKDDVAKIFNTDGIIRSPLRNPSGTRRSASQLEKEPYWSLSSVVRGAYDNGARATLAANTARTEIAKVAAEQAAQRALLQQLATGGAGSLSNEQFEELVARQTAAIEQAIAEARITFTVEDDTVE